MNIIFHRYNSICEPDFLDAFKTIGIDVIEDADEIRDKNIPLEKKVETLGNMILTHKPVFVFSINFFPYISMVCEKLNVLYLCVSVDCPVVELYSNMIKNKCNRVFLFDYAQYEEIHALNPECVFHMPLGVNVDRLDKVIGAPDWDGAGRNKIASDSAIGKTGESYYKYDVSFIGSLYNEKNKYADIYPQLPDRYKGMCDGLLTAQELLNGQEILEKAVSAELIDAIKKADSAFYSSDKNCVNTDAFVTVNHYLSTELTVRDRLNLMYVLSEGLRDSAQVHLFTRSDLTDLKAANAPIIYHDGAESLKEMPEIFRRSKINLNPTMRSIKMGLPQRIWDVLGAGGFLLTNYQAEIPEYFEIGTHLEAYETIEEAYEKITYYLEHEDERLEIAMNGYELIKSKHKVVDRVVEMIKTIMD